MKLAFLDSVFPGLTTTFLNREFAYLKERSSIDVIPIAMKRPQGNYINSEFKNYVRITKYLRPDSLLSIFAITFLAVIFKPIKCIHIIRLILKNWKYTYPRQQMKIIFHGMCGIYLSYYLKKNNFDSIHAHFETATTIALIANRFSGIPFSFTIHGNELYSDAILINDKMQHAKLVLTDSEYNVSQINLITYYKYTEKIKVVYNAIDTALFKNSSCKTIVSNPFRLLSVGSLRGYKGYPTVLKALKLFKSKGYHFIYEIIGGGEIEEEKMLKRLISDFKLDDTVILLGPQSFNYCKVKMEETDVFIIASEISKSGIRDGIPTVISESMLMKRPVVSTYISDIPNNIIHNKTGYLFPEKQSETLEEILEFIHNNYDSAKQVSERAYKFAQTRFNAETNYKNLIEHLYIASSKSPA